MNIRSTQTLINPKRHQCTGQQRKEKLTRQCVCKHTETANKKQLIRNGTKFSAWRGTVGIYTLTPTHTSSGTHTHMHSHAHKRAHKLCAKEKLSQMSQNRAERVAMERESWHLEEILLYFLMLPGPHCQKITLCLVHSVVRTMAVGLGQDTSERLLAPTAEQDLTPAREWGQEDIPRQGLAKQGFILRNVFFLRVSMSALMVWVILYWTVQKYNAEK